ncbi:DNA-binding response regulator, NarL/FixJ family, contains REC and HTH domains [Nitratireductor aquibiodomus]|uniref:DNA-binding response regulator, NarL/FixJ family, contains REC and HTH domains n=1 Tax=Nitratireductor aquibiodomus TaxID=204799 RepID=A0A1H4KY25_9HYPH|nr:response regulator transcription factor [Nitratireductor aquibiodomus]SEB63397.1 DNA-binding response regulator, NarL/FixJ family, contains REC and HTH domains [Nitratireductor aquibiodomus]
MTALSACTASSHGPGVPPEGARRSSIGRTSSRLQAQKGSVVLVDNRILARECLRSSLAAHPAPWDVVACSTIEEWQNEADRHPPLAAVLLHVGSANITDSHMEELIRQIIRISASAPLIILADRDDVVQIVNALDYGVRGYIPSSVSVEVCVEAINLALAGGVFVPASTVFAMREVINSDPTHDQRLTEMFTPRQIQVAEAIWQGKPNKIIAYELNMCESTVKVHIRNIMQKLKATNRTEAAYKVSALFTNSSVDLL